MSQLERLWAPWRLEFVSKAGDAPPPTDECFICRGLSLTNDRDSHLVHRGQHAAVYLNRFPYNNGHLLIAPLAHKGHLNELNAEETLEIHALLTRMIGYLDALMHPQGYNAGLNLGRPAGAGLPGHLHWHLVPRWNGDTNFMTITGDTRVIVQSLESLFDLLTEAIRKDATI